MNTLLTTWGEFLHPDHVLEEYPRPQMVRESYLNLNGFRDYAITGVSLPDGWNHTGSVFTGNAFVQSAQEVTAG